MGDEDQTDSANESDADEYLDTWEEGPAFGVGEDKDPICETPVEAWVSDLKISSTEEVPIPENLVDQVIGQEAASIVVKGGRAEKAHDNGR